MHSPTKNQVVSVSHTELVGNINGIRKNTLFFGSLWYNKARVGRGICLYCLSRAIFYWKAFRFVSSRLQNSFNFLASLFKVIHPLGLLKIIFSPTLAKGLPVSKINSWPRPALSQIATRQHQREKLGQNLYNTESTRRRAQPHSCWGGAGAARPLQRPWGAPKWPFRDPDSGSWLVTTQVPFGWPSGTYVLLASGQAASISLWPAQGTSKWEAGCCHVWRVMEGGYCSHGGSGTWRTPGMQIQGQGRNVGGVAL